MADNPQPEGPDGDDDNPRRLRTSPPSSFGGGTPGQFDPSTFDFSQIDISQMMQMLSSTGPINWEIARQTAEWVALEGRPEPAIDAADRKQFEELVQAAQTLVVGETGLYDTFAHHHRRPSGRRAGSTSTSPRSARCSRRSPRTLGDAMRTAGDDPEAEEELSAMIPGMPPGLPIGDVLRVVAPALLGVQAGSMIGYLAQHTFGRYDLPLPTGAPPDGDEPSLLFVVPNVDAFEEAWTLPRDDLRFYLALHEVVHAAVRSVPWVRSRLVRLAVEYVSNYEIDPMAFEEEFGTIDPSDPASLEAMTSSPERILGAMQSPRQARPLEELQRLTSVIEGYADNVTERVGPPSRPDASTASTRRCCVTASSAARPSASSKASSA